MRRALLLSFALLLVACPEPEPEPAWGLGTLASLGGTARALTRLESGVLLAVGDFGLLASPDGATWTEVAGEGLPEGPVTFLGPAGGDGVLAYVHGGGLFRSEDGGATWSASQAPDLPLQALLNPRARVVPFGAAVAGDQIWMASIGGLFDSGDGGATWQTNPVATSGNLNVLFTDVAASGQEVWAVAQLADSMLPASFEGLLGGTVFHSVDGGATWQDASGGSPATAPMAVVLDAGEPCVASLDAGVHCLRGGAWEAVGEPFDAVGLASTERGLVAATASRGSWLWDGQAWLRFGSGAQAGQAGDVTLGTDGVVRGLVDGLAPDGPPDAGGTVHVALSFHVNYYHSYRGDTPDEDGYGKDIRVIGTALDWLDERPQVHADWDIENHFSLDGWMASESPELVERIAARVADGTDDVRLMSWNNGAVANETWPEFEGSIGWAQDSYDASFVEQVPGVQPQENMFDPDHIGWYRDLGVEWITLFWGSNGFNAMRADTALSGPEPYGPVSLRDELTGSEMLWIPVYHHADVLDHGGLAAWVRQIGATVPGDSLLVVHFDADAESWENFAGELDRLAPMVADGAAAYTTIQDYLDAHPQPVGEVTVVGDLADGNGDGFQSWAEKDFNHEIGTEVVRSRRLADAASLWGGGDAGVEALVGAAIPSRLLTLSTTHFGLAAPYLHEDRVASARGYAAEAVAAGQAALDHAAELDPPSSGEIVLLNPRAAAGPALVEIPLQVDGAAWTGAEGVRLFDAAGADLPAAVEVKLVADPVQVVATAVVEVQASSVTTITWSYQPEPGPPGGGLSIDDLPDPVPLVAPFTECDGQRAEVTFEPADPGVDDRGMVVTLAQPGALPLCDGEGTIGVELQRWAGLPGTVVAVTAQLPELADAAAAESVALSPLACPGLASTVSWDTFGGNERTRPMRPGVDTWNGVAAASWVELGCAEGDPIRIAHRTTDRSSLAFAPMRERGGRALVAPLGTLWGEGPWHDGRTTGGSGLGEVATWLIGAQFRPAAPDWAGEQVHYRLLVGADLDAQTLELFAHPPVVVVGQ